MHDVATLFRRRLACRGTVQGVGFRPAVHRLATGLGLAGWVRNDPGGATIEVEGPRELVERFTAALAPSLPRLAVLESIEAVDLPPAGAASFEVTGSAPGPRRQALVPPDSALCDDCRRELDDPADRHHRYPFTTCTNCGPRFSLVHALPYDRERTSMARFPLCPPCAREYGDPRDRRFHAEPVSCPACGPQVRALDGSGGVLAERAEALGRARAALAAGAIVAVKGLGGFQLACRADSDGAVARLRARKRRPAKPFAVMARDLATARALVALDDAGAALLVSPSSPIVLAPAASNRPLAAPVAPGIDDLGVMLPTTPLHVELFRGAPYDVLVMTSGNASDEPICRTDAEAVDRLGAIADLLLVHDREIVRRVDDSVVRTAPTGPIVVRRSRGYVPAALPLPEPAAEPVLALGGHLQATACLAAGATAIPSQHVGDLDNEPGRAFLAEVADGLEAFLGARAAVLAVDEHPDYPSRWFGEELAARRGGRVIAVQHHLAHAAAVLADRRAFPGPDERAGALVLDGTGFGPDGTAWGGEVLVVGGDLAWERAARLEPLPLVGGERAVREPWRVAAAALARADAAGLLARLPGALPADAPFDAVAALARRGGSPLSSGAGRLFEAAGALAGLAPVNGYEGEAAIRFEALAARAARPGRAWDVPATGLDGAALLVALAERLARGGDAAACAAEFHATFCALAARLVADALPTGVRTVALGGGCLVNRLLASGLSAELTARGLVPLLPRSIPPGDGGLSYGQAVVAALALTRGTPRLVRA